MKKTSKVYEISEERFRSLTEQSRNITDLCRKIGIGVTGSGRVTVKKRIDDLDINTDHFCSKSPNRFKKTTEKDAILKFKKYDSKEAPPSTKSLKSYIIRFSMIDYSCIKCGNIGEWMGEPITLQLDHIDGDRSNNDLSNLRFLCPNCHTQTPTWGMKNRVGNSNKCSSCGKNISKRAKRCQKCMGRDFSKSRVKKFDPSFEELYKKVCLEKVSFKKLGELYGVSDNSVRKRCLRHGICPKTRTKIS